jgi:hypothetical protein
MRGLGLTKVCEINGLQRVMLLFKYFASKEFMLRVIDHHVLAIASTRDDRVLKIFLPGLFTVPKPNTVLPFTEY